MKILLKIYIGITLKKEIENLIINYKAKFPFMKYNRVDQIDLLKYEVGGKYETHIDAFF